MVGVLPVKAMALFEEVDGSAFILTIIYFLKEMELGRYRRLCEKIVIFVIDEVGGGSDGGLLEFIWVRGTLLLVEVGLRKGEVEWMNEVLRLSCSKVTVRVRVGVHRRK